MTVNSEQDPLLAAAERDGVRFVRFSYCDPSGVIRAKSVHVGSLEGRAREGLGLTRAQNAVNLLEDLVYVDGMEPVGEIRLLPDLSTYRVQPWVDGVASLICDQVGYDLVDWGCCGRSFLKRMIVAAADAGIEVQASFENEFYLATATPDGPQPWQNGPVYSTAGLDRGAPVMHDIAEALITQGLRVEQLLNEYGPGQQEISVRYAGALQAADNQIRFRDAVRGVAERHGLLASFSPKPFADGIGSGAHLHFSVWDGDRTRNVLHDPADPYAVSEEGGAFLAGVLDHLPALVALTCPSYVSYDRIRPQAWASSTVSWGYDNREASLRIASPFRGREMQSINAELKACDGSSNPYLALGGLIACGLDGMRRGLRLPEPARHDPTRLDEDARRRAGIRPLPGSQDEALKCLEVDDVLMSSLGDLLARCILAIRRAEFERCEREGMEWARRQSFSVF